jgi:5-hydroxyisourate hydrolase-like protein (transthyretin family)
MREADEGGAMKRILILLAASLPLSAAVTGVVINRSTGKPQAGAVVALNRLGQGGIELIDQAKSDTEGKFSINQEVRGPHLIRTAFDGVTYNHMLPPGSPTSNLTIDVYNASKQPGEAKVGKHMLLFEPTGGSVVVNETYLFHNEGKTAWYDPDNGTLRVYVPAGAGGKIKVEATAPGGMPIGAAVNKTSKADVYAVDFPVKPGETRFDVSYTVPYKTGDAYEGKVVSNDENTYLISPNGVTLSGENLTDLGSEPRTQAHIYGLQAKSYKVTLTGAEAEPPGGGPGGDTAESQDGGPQIEQILPRVNNKQVTILALAFGILGLGFALLYRASPTADNAKESHGRGRK